MNKSSPPLPQCIHIGLIEFAGRGDATGTATGQYQRVWYGGKDHYAILIKKLNLADLLPGQSCSYGHWQYGYAEPELHTHDFIELFWVEEGEGAHVIGGEARTVGPGALCLVRADDVHGFSAARPGGLLRFVNVAFPLALWESVRARHDGLVGQAFDLPAAEDREHQLDAEETGRMRSLSHDLAAGLRSPLAAEAFLLGAVTLLAGRRRRPESGLMPAALAAAIIAIQEPRYFRGGTAALARLAECSPEHLSRSVRRHLGGTPTDVVNEARIAHAARQLVTTRRPVADIAAECGLENLGHFYKLFRARHGTSPERYRKYAYSSTTVG